MNIAGRDFGTLQKLATGISPVSYPENALRPIVGCAAVVEQPVSLYRRFSSVHAGLRVEGVFAAPQLHGEAGQIVVAHGYTTKIVSGPDGEYRRNRHRDKRLYTDRVWFVREERT